MLIGMTYDLRDEYLAMGYGEEETAEFDRRDTVEAIEGALQSQGFSTDRIGHIRSLVGRLAGGDRWDLVFNIAEGVRGFGREAQVPAVLDAYEIPYTFSDPLVLAVTLHKGMTKHILANMGIRTAEFKVVESVDQVAAVRLPFPLFVKPVAEGTGKGIGAASRVDSHLALAACCGDLLERFQQPVLVERFLPGREFTVGVVGSGGEARVLGVMEVLVREGAEHGAYSYTNKKNYEEVVRYRLVEDAAASEAARVAVDAWRALGCRDGGRVDLKADQDGLPCFIEVNPLAGLHPVHSDLPILCSLVGVSFAELIGLVMRSALQRIEHHRSRGRRCGGQPQPADGETCARLEARVGPTPP